MITRELHKGVLLADLLGAKPLVVDHWNGQGEEGRCWKEAELEKRKAERRKRLFENR